MMRILIFFIIFFPYPHFFLGLLSTCGNDRMIGLGQQRSSNRDGERRNGWMCIWVWIESIDHPAVRNRSGGRKMF